MLQAPEATFAAPSLLPAPQTPLTLFAPAFNLFPLHPLQTPQQHHVAIPAPQTPLTLFAPAFNLFPLHPLQPLQQHHVAIHPAAHFHRPATKQKPRVKPQCSPPPPPPNDPAPSSSAASKREKRHKKFRPVAIPSRIQPSPRRKKQIVSSVASFRERLARSTERAFKTRERAAKTKRTHAASSSSNPVPEKKNLY